MAKNTKHNEPQSEVEELRINAEAANAVYTLEDVQRDFGIIEKALNGLTQRLDALEQLVIRAADHQGEGEQARAALAEATSTNSDN